MSHTLYLDQDHLQLSNQNAMLNLAAKNGETQHIPLLGIRKLVVKGNNTITARLLAKLGALGIGLVALSGQKHTPTLFLPNTHQDVSRRIQQTIAFHHAETAMLLSSTTISQKVSQQINYLTVQYAQNAEYRFVIGKAIGQLKGIQSKITRCDQTKALLGLEGAASAIYFKSLSALVADGYAFTHRNARPPKDPFNVLLSLAYSLLTAEIALALHVKGFDPYIGYLHTPAIGRPSLACDLIEPLRPMVDLFCLQLCQKQTLRPLHFKTTLANCTLERAGRLMFYAAWESQSQPRHQKIQAQIIWLTKALNSLSTEKPSTEKPSTEKLIASVATENDFNHTA